ncbi:MAG: hypothetical protein ACOZAQ_00580 [Pseudomonadota bacterium]
MKNLLNLYVEELRERPVSYGFPMLLGAMLAVALSMLALGALTQQRVQTLTQQQQSQQARVQVLMQSLAALESQMAGQEQRQALERDMARVARDIAARERALVELKGMVDQPSPGFSGILRGLSYASGHGVWLTRIHLDKDDPRAVLPEMRLEGQLQHGERLPIYIDALARADALRGLNFNSMQAQRAGEGANSPSIRFVLGTRSDDALEPLEARP